MPQSSQPHQEIGTRVIAAIHYFYVPSTLNLKGIRHRLSVALSAVRIRLKNSVHSLIGVSDARNQGP